MASETRCRMHLEQIHSSEINSGSLVKSTNYIYIHRTFSRKAQTAIGGNETIFPTFFCLHFGIKVKSEM